MTACTHPDVYVSSRDIPQCQTCGRILDYPELSYKADQLLQHLDRVKCAPMSVLAQHFTVSPATIRRAARELESKGLAERYLGPKCTGVQGAATAWVRRLFGGAS